MIRVFPRTGGLRKNRLRARIKFHVDKVGIDVFRAEVEEELTGEWAKADFDPTPLMELPPELEEDPPPLVPVPEIEESEAFSAWKGSNVFPQAQEGYNCVFVTLPLGDIASDQFGPLADIARNFAGGRLRTTAEQNLLYRWVPEGYLHAFWTALEAIGLPEDGANQLTDGGPCTGTMRRASGPPPGSVCSLRGRRSVGFVPNVREMQFVRPVCRRAMRPIPCHWYTNRGGGGIISGRTSIERDLSTTR